VLAALLALVAAACGGGGVPPAPASSTRPPPPHALAVDTGTVTVTLPARVRARIAAAPAASRLRLAASWARRHATALAGHGWRTHLHWGRRALAGVVAAAGRHAARTVHVHAEVRSTELTLPVVRQVYRDGCEAAALSMMLRERVGQRRLQAMLPIARPLEQESGAGGVVWGDPEEGFVGDVAGGGYGVYDRPLLALARRFDPGATDLTGGPLERVVDALRHGRPVVAWIALGPSDPVTWTSPSGRTIRANWAEHAITLTGYRGGVIAYNNPWTGARAQFTLAQFAAVWADLGDRAIAGSSLI
jgi:uncharacterized protein YvpB